MCQTRATPGRVHQLATGRRVAWARNRTEPVLAAWNAPFRQLRNPMGPSTATEEKNTRRNERPVVVMNNLRNLIEMKLHEKLKINLIKQTTTEKKSPVHLTEGKKFCVVRFVLEIFNDLQLLGLVWPNFWNSTVRGIEPEESLGRRRRVQSTFKRRNRAEGHHSGEYLEIGTVNLFLFCHVDRGAGA